MAGHDLYNQEQAAHGEPRLSFWRYVVSSDFGNSVMENWQSEYLQLIFGAGCPDPSHVIRYTPAGIPDPSFADAGVLEPYMGSSCGVLTALTVDEQDRPVLAGTPDVGPDHTFAVTRVEP